MFSWKQNVPIHLWRVAVYLIIFCGVKNFVGSGEIMRIFCKSWYNLFFILEYIHCKNLSATDKWPVNIIANLVLDPEPRPTQHARYRIHSSFCLAQCINCHCGGRCNVVSFLHFPFSFVNVRIYTYSEFHTESKGYIIKVACSIFLLKITWQRIFKMAGNILCLKSISWQHCLLTLHPEFQVLRSLNFSLNYIKNVHLHGFLGERLECNFQFLLFQF
jgi:hypothetical protein